MKRGKREKVKNPTLQSYILSMLSLVLCGAMFMSATMAWFTSEVTTTGNQIYVGTLDVDLRDANNKSLHGTAATLFDQVLLPTVTEPLTHWQDNAIALEPLQVVNEGDLAFRYELFLALDQGQGSAADLTAVTNCFEVWVLKDKLLPSTEYVDVESEEDDDEWEPAAVDANGDAETLTAILENGTPILSGVMKAEEVARKAQIAHRYTVALRMKPDTSATVIEVDEDGNEITVSIMGKTLTLNATLVANQLVDEDWATEDPTTKDLAAEGGEPTT